MPLTLTVSESGGFELHDEDEWYDGTLNHIEETDGQWGAGLKFIIHLDGEEDGFGDPRETWAFCSQKLSKRSKLYGWVKGLGWDPEDATVDLEAFIGARCQVMFEHYDGHDQDGNPQEKEKVTKIRKGKGQAKAKQPVSVAADTDDAPF